MIKLKVYKDKEMKAYDKTNGMEEAYEETYEETKENIDVNDTNVLFNESIWILELGSTLASQYAAKFHNDGTFEVIHPNLKIYYDGTYRFENGKLYLSFWDYETADGQITYVCDDDEFIWDDESQMFVSTSEFFGMPYIMYLDDQGYYESYF